MKNALTRNNVTPSSVASPSWSKATANGNNDTLDGHLFDEKAVKDDLAGIIGKIQYTVRSGYGAPETFHISIQRFGVGLKNGLSQILRRNRTLRTEIYRICCNGNSNCRRQDIGRIFHLRG